MPHTSNTSLSVDAVIFGGGVAGLWMLNRMCNAGYNAILFEQDKLGSGQTIASQGMIHGGVKYTLAGSLSGASEAIADMPDYWRACLSGKGDVNLSQTKVLSDHFYMWSTENSLSKMTAFLASKTLRGRINALSHRELPAVFNNESFKGKVYQLVDSVIDTPSLLANLAHNAKGRIFSLDWTHAQFLLKNQQAELLIEHAGEKISISAQQFIFSAGKGNASLLKSISATKPEMQVRPLQQVMVKHKNNYQLYAHCIGTDSTPRLTISSHHCADGSICWYLGGQLAEKGVTKSPIDLISEAKSELENLFPWLNWANAKWSTLPIERAEPKQNNLARPDKAFIDHVYTTDNTRGNKLRLDNVLVAWPTKLTLSPNLGNEMLNLLQRLNIYPLTSSDNPALLNFLPTPTVALSPWETADWLTIGESQ